MEKTSRATGTWLLAGLILMVGFAVVPTLLPLAMCPRCLGRALLTEPPESNGTPRWVCWKDLVPVECISCSDVGKISLLKKWRWKQEMSPAPPIYSSLDRSAFERHQRKRLASISAEVTLGTEEGRAPTRRPDLLPILAAALSDENWTVRREAVVALARARHEAGVPLLLLALSQEDRTVREQACGGLERFVDHPGLGPSIVEALERVSVEQREPDFDVRYAATLALYRHGHRVDSSVFVEALRGIHARSSIVAEAVVKFGRKDAILLLIRQLAIIPPGREEGLPIRKALEALTGESLGDDPVRWYRWLEKNRQQLPAQAE